MQVEEPNESFLGSQSYVSFVVFSFSEARFFPLGCNLSSEYKVLHKLYRLLQSSPQ